MNREVYGKLVFELGGAAASTAPLAPELPGLPAEMLREKAPAIPVLDEATVVRHYTRMSTNNFGVDSGFYPLGSCTMKYNPKINDAVATLPSMSRLHPLAPDCCAQGALEAYYTLQQALSEIGGMSEFTLNPYAGAHGELTGLMVIRAYHDERGEGAKRTKVIVPDSAHGTNPASAAVAGLEIVEVKSLADGTVDVEALRPLLDDTVAAMMMTNPNTLGIFESSIPEIAEMVHACGALMYYDGANLNAVLGKARPGDMGFDVMHINLHKTFSTPHGGGGPGSGPVGVRQGLEHLLPAPHVSRKEDGTFAVDRDPAGRLGSVTATLGNFAIELRALAYIMMLGGEGLARVGTFATLNANYVKECLRGDYLLPVNRVCKHEFVFDGLADKSTGVTTLDVAKRLLDYGYHAPTIYFPLLFHESLMIEPTETESLDTLDEFIDVMRRIAREAAETPDVVKTAPHDTPVTRPDDAAAALNPVVTYHMLIAEE